MSKENQTMKRNQILLHTDSRSKHLGFQCIFTNVCWIKIITDAEGLLPLHLKIHLGRARSQRKHVCIFSLAYDCGKVSWVLIHLVTFILFFCMFICCLLCLFCSVGFRILCLLRLLLFKLCFLSLWLFLLFGICVCCLLFIYFFICFL